MEPALPQRGLLRDDERTWYFTTGRSEHFSEYTPWFIKTGRDDLIERFGIPLDEYSKRCVEQIERWQTQLEEYGTANEIEVPNSVEYASQIVNSVWTGETSVIYGNVANDGYIPQLIDNCAVEVPRLVDRNGIQPTRVATIPPQLAAIMRSNVNVQELTVATLMEQRREHIYHAAMMDPHTGAELDLDQIWELVDERIAAHGDWLPDWVHERKE